VSADGHHLNLLLLSSGAGRDGEFLRYAADSVQRVLGAGIETVLFVPFASVLRSYDDVTAVVRQGFLNMLYDVKGVHCESNARKAIENADAVVVGGGNTFQLLHVLRELDLVRPLTERIRRGLPYVGWSAGANIVAPTIGTTNDMPIADGAGLAALGVVPFQINPHYTDGRPAGEPGESRAERLAEYCELHPDTNVVAMRDGAMLRVDGEVITVEGTSAISVFRKGRMPVEYRPGDSLPLLLAP
jgi:dipeptidase E